MDPKEFFARQLVETADAVEWAIAQIPAERLLLSPPHGNHPNSNRGFKTYFGEWSAYRLLFHLVYYEWAYALPAMKACAGEIDLHADIVFPESDEEDEMWRQECERGPDLPALLKKYRSLRQEQITVLRAIPEAGWNRESVRTGLGIVSPAFVVAKTLQHTFEHGNAILRNALFWEKALQWLDSPESEG